jgi:hypothetical protein
MTGLKYVIIGSALMISATQMGGGVFPIILFIVGLVAGMAGLSSKEK